MTSYLQFTHDEVLTDTDPPHRYARLLNQHLLESGFAARIRESDWDRIVAWSGTLGDSLFEPQPMNWMQAGQSAFSQAIDSLTQPLETNGSTLLIRPHARHVLNDIPGTLRFVREHSGQPFGIAFDPAALLEPSMLDRIEEHVTRSFEALGPIAAVIVIRDVQRDDDDRESGNLTECIPGQGVLPGRVLGELLRQMPETVPIALQDRSARSWLGLD